MSIPVLIANILCLLAFLAHTFVGDRELHLLEPAPQDRNSPEREKWTMARAGWHWVSVDLLMATIVLAVINFSGRISSEGLLLHLIALYFLVYGLVWLITVLISRSFPKNLLKLGQWILLLLISGLVYWGAQTNFS